MQAHEAFGRNALTKWMGSKMPRDRSGPFELGLSQPLKIRSDDPSLRSPVSVLPLLCNGAHEQRDVGDLPFVALASFRCGWHRNYFHWTVDVVPSLIEAYSFCAENQRELTVIMPTGAEQIQFPFIRHWVRLLDNRYGESRKVEIDSNVEVFGSILFLRNGRIKIGPKGNLVVGINRNLVGRIVDASCASMPTRTDEKLFLMRGKGAFRSSSDLDLTRVMKMGFTPVDLSQFGVSEQWRIVGQAREIWGVHGAALTNLIWSKDCTVTEFITVRHSVIRRRNEYAEISLANGNQHSFRIISFS